MKKLNKYHIVSLVLLALVLVVQLVPFTHSTLLKSDVEDQSMTWAELPVGVTGKDRNDWPTEIKYEKTDYWKNAQTLPATADAIVQTVKSTPDFGIWTVSDAVSTYEAAVADGTDADRIAAAKKNVEESVANVKSVCEKYPLYGEKQISLFTYIWNPSGALWANQFLAFLFVHVAFIAFALFAFLVKNYMAKAIVAFIFGISNICAFVQCFVLKSADLLAPYLPTVILLAVSAVAAVAVGVYFIPAYLADKAHNEEVKKSL